jgi:hypothetical protein
MSNPGPGNTLRAGIEIDGPKPSSQIRRCMDEIRAALDKVGGRLISQQVAGDPLKRARRQRRQRRGPQQA